MEFDDEDMEVVVLSTQPPELTPSEAAHVKVLRARCRYLRRAGQSCERMRRPARTRFVLLVGFVLTLAVVLLI
ncbi:MAG: hypothetical protein R3200_04210 [Xanthomonadales bacterium]|nr:hypothetical protein [Xanthomonadales bacterium]